jgi:CRP-like cAMP-binding protein
MWWFKLGGAGGVLAVVLVVLLRLPLASAQLLLSIGAGLWLSLTFLTAVGQFGAQNIFGASASLCFLMAYSTSRVENAADMETFLSVGLALSLLPILGWQRVLVRQRSVWASAMVVDLENPERSMMETFGVACRRLHGSIAFSDLRSAAPTVRKSIQNMELWFKGFALASDWDALGRVGLSACQWDDRRSIEEDSDSQLLTSWERKGALKLDQRVKLLKAQMCFKGFPDEELHILADLLEVVPFEGGDHLIEQDQPAQPMLEIIVKGKAVLEKRLPGGRVSTMAELGPKETLCMEDLFRDGVHDNSAYAMSDGVLVRLYRQHLLTWGAQKEGRLAQVVSSVKLSETIMKLSLFKDFSSAQVRLVMEQLKQRKCSAGENVITQGEEGDEFYLLDRGGVDILIGENKVASLGEGSYFGEIALLEKCLRTATVRTNTNSSLYYLTQKDFDKFFASGRGAQVLKNVSSARGGDAS